MCETSLWKQSSCFPGRMTQLSGAALNAEASLQLPATIYFSTPFWCLLAHSVICHKLLWTTLKFKVTLGHSPPPPHSLDSVWHSVGLVTVTLAVAGVLRPAGGTLVPPQSHRPVGEHRDTFGNAPAGLGERTMWDREDTETFSKVLFFWHCWGPG